MAAPLRILLLTHYFPPEIGAPQSRLGFLAKDLVARGHSVHVLTTFPSYPSGVIPTPYRNHLLRHETWNGVSVTRTWTYARPGHAFLRRLANYLSFSISCFLALPSLPRIDVILVETPPIFLVFSAVVLKLLKRARLVVHVADLWVKAAANFGYIPESGLLHSALRGLERFSYRFADALVVVSEEMIPELGGSDSRSSREVRVIPNGVDTEVFRAMPGRSERKRQLGFDGKFLLVFAGTHGHVTDMKVLVEAAKDLATEPSIHFLFVGEGVEKADLVQRAEEAGLHNVTFLDPVPESRLAEILAAADVGLNTLKPVPFTEHIISVKVFTYMACGLPFVTTDKRALRAIVSASGAGILVREGDSSALRDAILHLYRDRDLYAGLAARGVGYVRDSYSRQSAARETERLFLDLLDTRGSNKAPGTGVVPPAPGSSNQPNPLGTPVRETRSRGERL